MILRRQLAVASPISGPALARAALVASRPRPTASTVRDRAVDLVTATFRSRAVLLTDSGTSALVLALRLTVPRGGIVGLPAYGCVDLVAAALAAELRIRVYDIDPKTLSPDLESVEQLIRRGVDAIVVAHLFGYAADVRGVQQIAATAGITVIEDAAQGAGASTGQHRLGSLGELSVVSFGRGKGLCAGGGGALLAHNDRWRAVFDHADLLPPGRGWSGLATTTVQWLFGRPLVYALPSSLPWLHLGEMVYHPAGEPGRMSMVSASLVSSALSLEGDDVAQRRANARLLSESAVRARDVVPVSPIAGSNASYLRYAVRDLSGTRRARPRLGIVRPYPGALGEYPEARPIMERGEPATPGAIDVARRLFTLPTHRFVNAKDLGALAAWMSIPG